MAGAGQPTQRPWAALGSRGQVPLGGASVFESQLCAGLGAGDTTVNSGTGSPELIALLLMGTFSEHHISPTNVRADEGARCGVT